jgi:hypothetical protein
MDNFHVFSANPFRNLGLLRYDINLLRSIWEMAHKIQDELNHWKDTLWSEIEVIELSNECENYGKQIRKIEKRGKEWAVYSGLDTMIREVSNTLPIMNQLHNDTHRD